MPIHADSLRNLPRPGLQGLLHDEDGDRPAAEVSEILDMWSTIERAYKKLTTAEKDQVEAEAGPLGRGVRFPGFDGNAESEHHEIACCLIEKTGRFERFQGRKLDSRMPALDGYRRMLRVFAPMRPASNDARLSARRWRTRRNIRTEARPARATRLRYRMYPSASIFSRIC